MRSGLLAVLLWMLLAIPAWAAPSIDGHTSFFNNTPATSVVVSVPSGSSAGDCLVVTYEIGDCSATTAPTGWTQVGSVTTNDTCWDGFSKFTRVEQGGDTSWTFTFPSSKTYYGSIISVAGSNCAVEAYGANVTAGTGSSAFAAPSETTANADLVITYAASYYSLHQICGGTGNWSVPTSPNTLTAIWQDGPSGDNQEISYVGGAAWYGVQSGSGTSFTGESLTLSCSNLNWIAATLALEPASVATPTPTATATGATSTATPTATATATAVASQGTYVPLDKYGGDTLVNCPKGASSIWYTQQIGNRWWFCDPLGNGVFLTSIYDVSITGAGYRYQTRILPTAACTGAGVPASGCTGSGTCVGCNNRYWIGYPVNTNVGAGEQTVPGVWYYNWVLHQIDLMRYMGFNSFSDDSLVVFWPTRTDNNWNTANHTLPVAYRMPFINKAGNSQYTRSNNAGCGATSAIKDLGAGIPGTVNAAYAQLIDDFFDPRYPACATNIINGAFSNGAMDSPSAPNFDYFAAVVMDETGQNNFLVAGTDYPFVVGNTQGTSTNGGIHIGYETLVGDPIQTGNAAAHDHEVYSKVKLADQLVTEYGCTGAGGCCTGVGTGTCSVDPSCTATLPTYCMGDTYIGSSGMTTAKNALNTAWGSSYTTLSTSDTNCTSNLGECLVGNAICTGSTTPFSWCTGNGTGSAVAYASWGTGTGLLDEKGAGTWLGDECSLGSNTSTGACGSPQGGTYTSETASMITDMRNFYKSYVDVFYSTLSTGYRATLGAGFPMIVEVGSYGTLPHQEVLQEMAKYNIIPSPASAYCPTCTFFQARVDSLATWYGNGPWIDQVFIQSNADSQTAWAGIAANAPQATTQGNRGIAYNSWITRIENEHDSATNTYHDIGFGMWGLQDQDDSQKQDFGPISSDDHLYDGRCATGAFSLDAYGLPCGERVLDNTMCGLAGADLTECTGAGTGTVPATPSANYGCTASVTPYACCTGVKTGTCTTNYGDYTDYVVTTNRSIYPNIAPLGVYAGGVQ